MKINRVWAMPNKWTFTIKPIKKLLLDEVGLREKWADPFAGMSFASPINKIAYISKNDLDETLPIRSHLDALEFLKLQKSNYFDGVLYDPPYSITQARQYGKKEYASMKYWAECKNEMARSIKLGGKAICFGWNSNGLGKNRGFKIIEILLVAHGGSKNDTIVTVEQRELKND